MITDVFNLLFTLRCSYRNYILPGYVDDCFLFAFGAEQGEVYLDFQPYLPVITAAMPKTAAKPMRKYRAILLKSKKPLPITVTAPMIAMTVNTAIITLAILQMAFFMVILHTMFGFIDRKHILPGYADYSFLLAFGAE